MDREAGNSGSLNILTKLGVVLSAGRQREKGTQEEIKDREKEEVTMRGEKQTKGWSSPVISSVSKCISSA